MAKDGGVGERVGEEMRCRSQVEVSGEKTVKMQQVGSDKRSL